MTELERTSDGDINNCALANGDEESGCQMCLGSCPDRLRLSKLGRWLEREAQYALNEHVKPEIQALAKRGNITPAEVVEIRCNSWEWEHLVPAMNNEAFVARMEHAIKNCGWHKRPYGSYNEAVEGLYAPELLKRFTLVADVLEAIRGELGCFDYVATGVRIAIKALEGYASNPLEKYSTRAKVALAMIRGKSLNATCEACGEKLVVVEEEGVPAIFCADCGGGCVSMPREEMLP